MGGTRTTRTRAVTEDAILERCSHILRHASILIARSGVEGFSFAALSDSCGFSAGMIQHYFRTREKLIHATVEFRIAATVAEWQRIVQDSNDAVSLIRDLLTFTVQGKTPFEEAWGFWIEVYAAAHKDAGIRDSVADAVLGWKTIFVEALDAAVLEKAIEPDLDVDELASALVALADGLAIQTLIGVQGSSPDRMVRILHRFAAHELGLEIGRFAPDPISAQQQTHGVPL